MNSRRFLVFPEGISNSSRFPEVVDTLNTHMTRRTTKDGTESTNTATTPKFDFLNICDLNTIYETCNAKNIRQRVLFMLRRLT